MIYFASSSDMFFCIGLINPGRDPYRKLKDLQGLSPHQVRYLGFVDGGRAELRRLRAQFAAQTGGSGEGWMRLTPLVFDWLQNNALTEYETDPVRRQRWAQIDILLNPGRVETAHESSTMFSQKGFYGPTK